MVDNRRDQNNREYDKMAQSSSNIRHINSINYHTNANSSNCIVDTNTNKQNDDTIGHNSHNNGRIAHQSEAGNRRPKVGKNLSPSTRRTTFANYQTGTKGERQKDIDGLDLKLLNLLQRGYDNKQIAKSVDNPLSTIQRRTRIIFERGLAASRVEPDYAKIGLKKGFLLMRLRGGKIPQIVERLRKIRGIVSISANIGSFPIICVIVYHNTTELWDIISNVQEQDNVREVTWSEEIYSVGTDHDILDLPFP